MLAIFFVSQATYAQQATFAFGVGDSVSSNGFSNSAYANLWIGTSGGRGVTSGFYASGNLGASYWRSDPYAVDHSGQPYRGNLNYRPQFWVLSAGPTKTLTNKMTLYGGLGAGYRRSSAQQQNATRLNVNAGVMYTLSQQSSIHVTADSANRGVALSLGIRIL